MYTEHIWSINAFLWKTKLLPDITVGVTMHSKCALFEGTMYSKSTAQLR